MQYRKTTEQRRKIYMNIKDRNDNKQEKKTKI